MLLRPISENSPLMAVGKATVENAGTAQRHDLFRHLTHLQTVALHTVIKPFEPQLGRFVRIVQTLHPFINGKAHRMQFARQLERIGGFPRACAPTHKVYVECGCFHGLVDQTRMTHPSVHLGLCLIHQGGQRQAHIFGTFA